MLSNQPGADIRPDSTPSWEVCLSVEQRLFSAILVSKTSLKLGEAGNWKKRIFILCSIRSITGKSSNKNIVSFCHKGQRLVKYCVGISH